MFFGSDVYGVRKWSRIGVTGPNIFDRRTSRLSLFYPHMGNCIEQYTMSKWQYNDKMFNTEYSEIWSGIWAISFWCTYKRYSVTSFLCRVFTKIFPTYLRVCASVPRKATKKVVCHVIVAMLCRVFVTHRQNVLDIWLSFFTCSLSRSLIIDACLILCKVEHHTKWMDGQAKCGEKDEEKWWYSHTCLGVFLFRLLFWACKKS